MGKNLYSLMLMEEIIEEIDQLAYEKNTNRSQLINTILANYLGYETKEQRIEKILNQVVELVEQEHDIRFNNQVINTAVQFNTFIKFKYNPSIKYSYEFYTKSGKKYASLKVSTRSKSETLCNHLSRFFQIFKFIDKKRLNEIKAGEIIVTEKQEGDRKFLRHFFSDISIDQVPNELISQYLSQYLMMLDQCLRYYFEHLDDIEDVSENIDKIYCRYMKGLKFNLTK